MRGVHSAVDDIRRNVFTEVAKLGYNGGNYAENIAAIPFNIIKGQVANHRSEERRVGKEC